MARQRRQTLLGAASLRLGLAGHEYRCDAVRNGAQQIDFALMELAQSAHSIKADKSHECPQREHRHHHQRADGLCFQNLALGPAMVRQGIHITHRDRITGMESIHPERECLDRHGLQVFDLGGNPLCAPLVSVAHGFALKQEHVGTIDTEMLTEGSQPLRNGFVHGISLNVQHARNDAANQVLCLQQSCKPLGCGVVVHWFGASPHARARGGGPPSYRIQRDLADFRETMPLRGLGRPDSGRRTVTADLLYPPDLDATGVGSSRHWRPE